MNAQSLLLVACILLFFHENTLTQYYLLSISQIGSGITINNSQRWLDIDSVTIDVAGMSNLLVSVGINMQPDGILTSGREANYTIYRRDNITNERGIV